MREHSPLLDTMREHSPLLDRRVFLPLLVMGAISACGGAGEFDAWCNTPGREIELLLYTITPGFAAAAAVWWTRKRRLEGWDLRDSPGAPSTGILVWVFLGAFLVSGLVFSFFLSGADGCAPEQRTTNLWFTWQGLLVAAVLCLLGLIAANWSYTRR